MSVDGDTINATMKDVLRKEGYFAKREPMKGMSVRSLVHGVFEELQGETDDRDCIDEAVRNLLSRHRALWKKKPHSAAIQKIKGRQKYWLNTSQLDANPSTRGFKCSLSTRTQALQSGSGGSIASQSQARETTSALSDATNVADEILAEKAELGRPATTSDIVDTIAYELEIHGREVFKKDIELILLEFKKMIADHLGENGPGVFTLTNIAKMKVERPEGSKEVIATLTPLKWLKDMGIKKQLKSVN